MDNSLNKGNPQKADEHIPKNALEIIELIQKVNSIILRMDLSGNIIFLNEFGQKFFGYSESEIIGRNVIGTIVPSTDNSGQDLKVMIDDIMIHPQKYVNNENENILRSGQRVWVSWTNKAIQDNDGKLREVLSIGNDITRLKQVETELVKAKGLAESASKAGVVVCDAKWKIKSMNASARKYFDTSDPFGSDKDFLQIMLKNYSPSVPKEEIANLSNTHKAFELSRPEKGTVKALYLQASMEVMKNQLHEISSIIVILQDVTYSKYQEMTKGEFFDIISNKLKAPVGKIEDAIELCKMAQISGPLSQKQKEFLDAASAECKGLKGLIEKLVKFVELSPK